MDDDFSDGEEFSENEDVDEEDDADTPAIEDDTETTLNTKSNQYICYEVDPADRKTSNVMTQFEIARVVGERAQAIENGGMYFVEAREGDSALDIAKRELSEGKIPFYIHRPIEKNINYCVVEVWSANELSLPTTFS